MRTLNNMVKAATSIGYAAIARKKKRASAEVKRKAVKPKPSVKAIWTSGAAIGATGVRRYRLYQPHDVQYTERLPLMVMLHGCGQNAEILAHSTRMNNLAANRRFLVLYPEQDHTANAQNCWNWFDTRSGRAQREADSIDAAINHACRLYPIDQERIVLSGLSGGASMAAFMAVRNPTRYRAIAMHSGVAPGVAQSSASAVMAMRGRRATSLPLPAGIPLPPLLVIHGSEDKVVAPVNGAYAASLWGAHFGARTTAPRTIKRGNRYSITVTDYRTPKSLAATLCEVHGLGHAWSGGASGHAYSDHQGPDASTMIWAFANKQFKLSSPRQQ